MNNTEPDNVSGSVTLVNLEFVQNYSFWENDKYVLRMNDENKSEFVMSRERLQKIKHMFLETASF